MYISELELHGFKSFAYKTKVKFDSGITAIVGPNGCGKSNIVDAMRWVMGEQRPTLLRSSTMTNVIFNGTAQKNALGMAEVSLTFVNNRGLLPTEYSEVTITRRLYRSGESDYLINGTKCRLKDIMELFMDTGMGSDAYSVIELKMVEEILNDKNNDRRHLFEEAAGVTRYKEKRKKTFRKLEETQKDLQRIEDILSEVRKQTRSLELQAERAEKAKKYREEFEYLDKALHKHEYITIQEELDPLEERISNAEKEKNEILKSIEQLEQAEEITRSRLNEKERKQAEVQRYVSKLHDEIQESETSLRITREKISNEKGVIEQYRKDIEQTEEDLTELKELFSQTSDRLEKYEKELGQAEDNLNSSQKRYREIQQEYSDVRNELDRLDEEKNNLNESLNELQTERIRIESRIENTGEDLLRIDDEIESINKQIEALKKNKKKLSDKLSEAQNSVDEKQKELREARESRQELLEKRDKVKDDIREYQSDLEAIRSEIALLSDIAHSKEVFPGSVRYLLDEFKNEYNLEGVVSDLISTNEEDAIALEAALGDALNYIVTDTLENARQAAEVLKKENKGRATFIPLNQLSGSYKVDKKSLYHQVKTSDEYKPLAQLLLGHVLIAENVDEAYGLIKNSHQICVTPEGEVVTSNQFLQSGSQNKHAGLRVGLEDKIKNLENKAGSINAKMRDYEKDLKSINKRLSSIDIDGAEKKLDRRKGEFQDLEQQVSSITSRIEIYHRNKLELEERKEQRLNNKKSLKEQLESIKPRREEMTELKNELRKNIEERQGILDKLEQERSIAQSRFNDAQLKYQDLKNRVENHEKEITRAQNGIKSLKERLELRSGRMEDAHKKIEQYEEKVKNLNEKNVELKEEKKEADSQLEKAREATSEQRGRINEIEKELKEIRRRKDVNIELLHHLTMAKEKFELKAENLSDHIWENYEMVMKQIDETLPEDKEPEEVKERISWLRQKLNQIGEVNPLAIEEYKEEKERLDFYEEQIADLQKAEDELRESIDEINKTATERFNETFEKIRVNFQNVFHTLFNEDDYCDLIVEEDADDPLEAKIQIKANPRGKRPSTINQLSGGEKTLTAIALLFAIYLVKPSPFCVLDEVDAPLDDANIERFSGMIKKFSDDTQFIIITHNKKTMSKAEMMYGITMPETGISRLVGVQLDEIPEA